MPLFPHATTQSKAARVCNFATRHVHLIIYIADDAENYSFECYNTFIDLNKRYDLCIDLKNKRNEKNTTCRFCINPFVSV